MRQICVAAMGAALLAGCTQPYQPLYVAPARPLPTWEAPPQATLKPPAPMPMPAPRIEPEPELQAEPVSTPEVLADAPTPNPTITSPAIVKPAPAPAVPLMGFRPMRGQATGL